MPSLSDALLWLQHTYHRNYCGNYRIAVCVSLPLRETSCCGFLVLFLQVYMFGYSFMSGIYAYTLCFMYIML